MIRIVIADDQKLLRESFKNIIENNSAMNVCSLAANGMEALEQCARHHPDVILMDLLMPVLNGIEATRLIKQQHPYVKVLILSSSDDEQDVSQALFHGADGYVLKNIGVEELILAIQSILHGMEIIQKDVFNPGSFNRAIEEPPRTNVPLTVEGIQILLSEREKAIIRMVVDGKSNKEIASALHIAEGTVKNIITEIIAKLQVKDRTQLAVYAIRNHLA